MPDILVTFLSTMSVGLGAALALTATRASQVARRLQETGTVAAKQLASTSEEIKRRTSWLDHQQREIEWLRSELEKRPRRVQQIYRILTLGIKGTGKTALTLKWANPLIKLSAIPQTKIERYQRTVSQVLVDDVLTEYVFEICDWGGEHAVEAQQELITREIHGLLIVVDLGGPDASHVDPARVEEQLREFEPQALKFFFGPQTVATCKSVVLFINKSDLMAGTPADVEREATQYYRPLIANLLTRSSEVDIRVLVGSASSGHSTHHLFSHFVEHILPPAAYDRQLLQQMKGDEPPTIQIKDDNE